MVGLSAAAGKFGGEPRFAFVAGVIGAYAHGVADGSRALRKSARNGH
jgi:hypothetical protein